MTEISEVVKIIVAVLAIVQILLGCSAWYIGIQIKVLRLELMPRELCDERYGQLKEDLSDIHAALAAIQVRIDQNCQPYCNKS